MVCADAINPVGTQIYPMMVSPMRWFLAAASLVYARVDRIPSGRSVLVLVATLELGKVDGADLAALCRKPVTIFGQGRPRGLMGHFENGSSGAQLGHGQTWTQCVPRPGHWLESGGPEATCLW